MANRPLSFTSSGDDSVQGDRVLRPPADAEDEPDVGPEELRLHERRRLVLVGADEEAEVICRRRD